MPEYRITKDGTPMVRQPEYVMKPVRVFRWRPMTKAEVREYIADYEQRKDHVPHQLTTWYENFVDRMRASLRTKKASKHV